MLLAIYGIGLVPPRRSVTRPVDRSIAKSLPRGRDPSHECTCTPSNPVRDITVSEITLTGNTTSDGASANRPMVLLVNPVAGRGASARRADQVQRALAAIGVVERHDTRAPGDETRIARDAAIRNARVLAVVGGDGSVSHAARGLVESNSHTPLAIFSAGTGNDFAKSLDAPVHDIDAMVARIISGNTRTVDVGFVDDIPFVNAAGFGFDVEVLERMRTPGLLRGTAAYVGTALGALVGYRGFRARLRDDAERAQLMLVFANGRYFGGAFHIAPQALLDDGRLDLVSIGDAPTFRRLALFAKALKGAHLGEVEIVHDRIERCRVTFAAPPAFEADGELHQARAAVVEVSVRRGALRVVV